MPSFTYTGAPEVYTVPAGIRTLLLEVRGAAGGANEGATFAGGLGGYVAMLVAVSPGEQFDIRVGGLGATGTTDGVAAAGGYNGGGVSGQANANAGAGGGGGASDIRPAGGGLGDRILVGGGGGGASGGAIGGAAGHPNGSPGAAQSAGQPGEGGTQTAGGAGGPSTSATPGLPGSFGQGGAGAPGVTARAAGGGGGGWYGGGGGGERVGTSAGAGGGGGGSSYYSKARAIGDVVVVGTNSGNGSIDITEYAGADPTDPTAVPFASSGGTIVEPGDGYRYHIFTTDDDLDVDTAGPAEILIVGGGGAGGPSAATSTGAGGGGGGGGMVVRPVDLVVGLVAVTVGAGGVGISTPGGDTSIGVDYVAQGGGAGPGAKDRTLASGAGGNSSTAQGTSGWQGNDGGTGTPSGTTTNRRGGGGGGAATPGLSNAGLRAGGDGRYVDWADALGYGEDGYFAGGGGGGSRSGADGGGIGGLGGAGNGGFNLLAGTNGTANTGGGGGGSGGTQTVSSGGSGIAIVRYRLPWTPLVVDLESAGTMVALVTSASPKAVVSADLSSAGTMTAVVQSRVSRRVEVRREYLWVSGLDGVQRGVIR